MQWFTLACGLSGLSMGWLFAPAIGILLSSLQLWLFLLALWLAAEMDFVQCVTWGVVGLFTHQGAYLGGLLTRSGLHGESAQSLVEKVESDLDMLDEVSQRLERNAPPQLDDETRRLAGLAQSLRRTLLRERHVKDVLKDRGRMTV